LPSDDLPIDAISHNIRQEVIESQIVAASEIPVSKLESEQAKHQSKLTKNELKKAKLQLKEVELQNRELELKLNDHQQAHEMRQRFFGFSRWLLTGVVLASTLAMAAYMIGHWGQIESVVMVAFFGSIAAEVIGLAAIVARYLFPSNDKTGNSD